MAFPELNVDWEKVCVAQGHIPVSDSTERTTLLVRTLGYERANDSPWASLKGIDGRLDFFTRFNGLIGQVNDWSLVINYLSALENACDNQFYKSCLGEQKRKVEAAFTAWQNKGSQEAVGSDATLSRSGEDASSAPSLSSVTYQRLQQTDFVCHCLQSTLKDNMPLTRLFCDVLANRVDTGVEPLTKFFLESRVHGEGDFPLRQFRRVLKAMRDKRVRVAASPHKPTLVIIKDLLTVASFPEEDMEKIENAMIQVLAEDPAIMDFAEINSHSQRDAEKLLIATRIKLSGSAFDDWQIPQLLNHDFSASKDFSVLMDKVLVVPEPPSPPDRADKVEWYAKTCLIALGYDLDSPHSMSAVFHDELVQKAEEDTVVAMFITFEKRETIKILRHAFPRLLLIVLSEKNAFRYSQIFIDLLEIDNLLRRILESSSDR